MNILTPKISDDLFWSLTFLPFSSPLFQNKKFLLEIFFTQFVLCLIAITVLLEILGDGCMGRPPLADPGLQKRGSKFLPKFLNDPFLGVSRKNFCISPQNSIYLPKFLMTFFLVIDLFRVLYMVFFHRGAKSAADIDTGGGQNPYFSTKSQYFHCSFCPGGGQTPLPISMGEEHGRICPPGSATAVPHLKFWGTMPPFPSKSPPMGLALN